MAPIRGSGEKRSRGPLARVSMALAVLLVVTAIPATAGAVSVNDWLCVGVPDGGFADVGPGNIHKADIDCLKFYEITSGTTPTTFNPKGAVNRWQMALFIVRTGGFSGLSGADQGFRDILGLPAETQTAINQISQMGITTGTAPSVYSPNQAVTRWQMALFLTRLVRVNGLALPDGSGQGFTDISGLPVDQRTAINQLAQLGITTGTTTTTYSPNATVTREQMASFLMRTFKLLWTLPTGIGGTCTPPLPTDPAVPITPGTVCDLSFEYPQGTTFIVRHAWLAGLPFESPEDQAGFRSAATRVEVLVDGVSVALTQRSITAGSVEVRWWEYVAAGGLSGFHNIEVRWYFDGELRTTVRHGITFN